MASYKKTYSDEQSLNFAIPILLILFIGAVYFFVRRGDEAGFVSFILIGIAALTIFYWNRIIKKIVNERRPKYASVREQETKKWVYDLFKDDGGEFVFVAEVPGPEEKIMVRLIDGILYIRGSGGFSKEVVAEGSEGMEIVDFKYRNGVLTLKIKRSKDF